MESTFKFNMVAFELGSSHSPGTLVKQTASQISTYFSSSTFNFSAMQTEISEITSQPKAVTQNTHNKYHLRQKKARLLQQRPLTELTLHKILPPATFDCLIESSETCDSFTKALTRCRNKLKEQMDEVPNILEALASLNVRKDWGVIYPRLLRIVETSLCRSSHGRMAIEELLALNGRMIEWLYKQDKETVDTYKDCILALVEPWILALCTDSDTKVTKLRECLAQRVEIEREEVDQYIPLKATDESRIVVTSESLKEFQQKPLHSPLEEKERIQYIHTFSPYQPHIFSSLSVQLAIRRVLEMPLAIPELDSKYLYIYWCPGNFGYVKIGVTDDVSQRLRSWEEKCKQDVQEHLQQAMGERIIVKHSLRVEKLVHTELKEVRYQEMCCKGCGGRHIEWFHTSTEHAAKVIKKYSEWTATNPYQLHKASNRWEKDEQIEKRKVEELSEPINLQSLKSSVGFPRRKAPLRLPTQKQSPGRDNKFG